VEEIPKCTLHLGRKVQRVREIIGMKQIALADSTGMSQQNISKLEQSEQIAEDTLEKLAKGLGVTADFIQKFDEWKAVHTIQMSYRCSDNLEHKQEYKQPKISNTNPAEHAVEIFECLLQSEKEKLVLLTKANQAIKDLVRHINEMKR
jgi:transcriptional regulator with XRE-family HTH domain